MQWLVLLAEPKLDVGLGLKVRLQCTFDQTLHLVRSGFQFLRYNCSEKGSQRNLLYLVVDGSETEDLHLVKTIGSRACTNAHCRSCQTRWSQWVSFPCEKVTLTWWPCPWQSYMHCDCLFQIPFGDQSFPRKIHWDQESPPCSYCQPSSLSCPFLCPNLLWPHVHVHVSEKCPGIGWRLAALRCSRCGMSHASDRWRTRRCIDRLHHVHLQGIPSVAANLFSKPFTK